MNVKDVMTKNPACCTPDSKLSEVARMMVSRDCGQIPVVENQSTKKPVGVVTDRDIIVRTVAAGKNPLNMTAREVMSSPVVTVRPDTRIEECCHTLESKQVRRVPVLDRSQRLVGIVSLGDLATETRDDRVSGEVLERVSGPAWPDR